MADEQPDLISEVPDLVLRPAAPEDAPAVAAVYGKARRAAVPAMPPALHTEAEDREFFGRLIAGDAEVWLATPPDLAEPIGFVAVQGEWMHSLYVHPDRTGQGVGSALLDLVKAVRPQGFGLWVFETNFGARRFYERHGLVAVRRTDGIGNEEHAPDLQLLWPGADPVRALREAIDTTDQELARLLDLRAGLTAEIQRHKATDGAPAPRDPAREAEIVANMAPLAPRLGSERLAAIMHAVIGESLAAVQPQAFPVPEE